jgi:hypothetical protein
MCYPPTSANHCPLWRALVEFHEGSYLADEGQLRATGGDREAEEIRREREKTVGVLKVSMSE